MINASLPQQPILFFILVTGLLFSGIAVHSQIGLGQKNESGMPTGSDDLPAVTMDSCMGAVGKKGIAQVFVAACLIFAPSVFKAVGDTLGLVDKSGGVEPFPMTPRATGDESPADSSDEGTAAATESDSSGDDDLTSGDDVSSRDQLNDNMNDGSSD